MNDYLRPEEEKELARKIGKALQTPEDEPSARISPAAIESRLRSEQNAARPKARPGRKGWIAATASIAACAAGLLLFVLLRQAGGPGCTGPACLTVSETGQTENETFGDASPSPTGAPEPDDGFLDGNAGGSAAPDGGDSIKDDSLTDSTQTVGLPQATRPSQEAQGGSSQQAENAPTRQTAAATQKDTQPGSAALWRVTESEAAALLAQGAVLIDVRDAGSFASGHLDGAVNLPLASLADEALSFDKAAVLLVYGSTESESARAAQILAAQGYARAGSLGALSALTLPTAG